MSKYGQRTKKTPFYNAENFSLPSTSGRAFDSNITADSTNGITSGAVFSAIDSKQNRIDNDHRLNANLIANGSISNSEFQFLNGLDANVKDTFTSISTSLSQKQGLISAGTNLSFNGNTLNASSGIPNITANRVCVSNSNGDLVASNITTTKLDFLDGMTGDTIQNQLATKQPTITENSLSISKTNGLQTALDAKQPTITNGSLSISKTNGLQTALDDKQDVITDNSLTVSKTNGLQNALDAKQATITDGDLTIARTSGLQSALNAKQDTINDGDLTIARTSGLQSALDAKQDVITDNSLSISKTNGLQSALDAKQATITDGDLTIARTSGLQSALDAKQATITDGDLTIARTSGLQSALDAKPNILRTYNIQNLSVPNDKMYKIKNLFVLPLHGQLNTTTNQGNIYFPDVYSGSNKSLTYSSAVVSRAIIDNDVFSVVAPSYTTETTNNQTQQTGSAARFGIKILETGLYKYTFNYNIENETHNNRLSVQVGLAILNTLTNGTEQSTLINNSISREYMRDDNFGQYCNNSGSGYFEVSSDMLNSSNGVFVKVDVRMDRTSGETFNENCNSLKFQFGGIEIQKIAELAS